MAKYTSECKYMAKYALISGIIGPNRVISNMNAQTN